MEGYQEAMRAIERERVNFLNKIDLVQPSFEEQHQLEWGCRYQEEELFSLRSELAKVSQEVEAETQQLRDREEVIRAIRDEQQQDRVKIQTLLALSQPVTPDITVVFQALAPDACPPPPPPPPPRPRTPSAPPPASSTRVGGRPHSSSRSPLPGGGRERRSASPPSHARRPGVGSEGAAGRGDSGGDGGGGGLDEQTRSPSWGRRRDCVSASGVRDGGDDGGGGDEGRRFSGEEDTDDQEEAGWDGGGDRASDDGNDCGDDDEREEDRRRRQDGAEGVSYGLRPGRRWVSETPEGGGGEGGGGGEAATGGMREGGASRTGRGWGETRGRADLSRRRRRRRRRSSERARKGKEGNKLRCTRGYKEHLERRLELTQRHLRELERLDLSYHETLQRDRQEREVQIQVQEENISLVLESLRRRTAEVDGRLAEATDDYLRLRHKAKQAHAASAEEQRQCAEAREKSQAEVAGLRAAAEAEMEVIKQEGRRRLEDCTSGLREELVAAEEALQGERSHHALIKQRFEERVARAREGVLLTRRRHNKLVRRRAEEVVHLSDEMSALRRGVTELERRMFAAW